jgi:hypothetical protein
MRLLPTALVLGLALATAALSASPDAWDAFRKEVAAACIAAAAPLIDNAAADVDPFGSESYGLALLHGKAKGAESDIRAICVFDKATKAVEIGGELPAAE